MSLLLDALNRASRDKATVQAAIAQVDPAVTHLPPPLSLVTEPQTAPEWPSLELTKLTLEGMSDSTAQAPERQIPESTGSEPLAPTPEPNAATTQAIATPISEVTSAQPEARLPTWSLPPRLAASPTEADHTRNTPLGARVAQKIARAKAPAEQPNHQRVWVLGGLALVLSAAMGSALLGVWGDPMTLVQYVGLGGPTTTVTGITPPQAANATAPLSTASETLVLNTPVGKPAVPTEAPVRKTKSTASTVTRSPPQRPLGARATPPPQPEPPQASLQSRSSGPSVLEQAYGALTQGRFQEASQGYSQALANNPEERDALLGMAYIAQQQGRPDEAQLFYKRVLRQEPGNAAARSALLMLGPFSDAQDFDSSSRDVAQQNPDSAAAQSVLGHALVRQDRLAEAQLAFSRALQLEPNVARHAFNLAVAWDRLHQYAAAQHYYERAAALVMQVGSDRGSGFSLAEVQARLTQLRMATEASRP